MSYDITLTATTTDGVPVEVFWRNHTSNTSRLWRDLGCDLAEYDGKRAVELLATLVPAARELFQNLPRYRSYDADNRWGTADSTLDFLMEIRDAALRHPSAIVGVSR